SDVAVRQHVIEAVEQEDGSAGAVIEPGRGFGQPRCGLFDVRRQAGGVEVAVAQRRGDDRAAVRTDPAIRGADAVDLVAAAAPVDEGGEVEPGEELRELGPVSEGGGDVRNAR